MSPRSLVVTRILPVARTSLVRRLHASSLQQGGATPPLPPFKRNPIKNTSLIENTDAIWDDGVAPELALDFDMPNTSSGEAVAWFTGGFGVFALIYGVLKVAFAGPDDNPALPHATDCVDQDYSAK